MTFMITVRPKKITKQNSPVRDGCKVHADSSTSLTITLTASSSQLGLSVPAETQTVVHYMGSHRVPDAIQKQAEKKQFKCPQNNAYARECNTDAS